MSEIAVDTSTAEQPYYSLSSGSSSSPTPINSPTTDTHNIFPSNIFKLNEILTNKIITPPQTSDQTVKHDCPNKELEDEDYEISIPDASGSSTSTPTPPDEYVEKLHQAEVMIAKLKNENRHQRKEVK